MTDLADLSGRPGTYTLLVTLDAPTTLAVGALGAVRFDAGAYAYTGSAFGPGGLARVARHRRLAEADPGTRHWHVDALLPAATLQDAFVAVEEAVECAVASSLPGDRVPGFGASDCDCDSHLAYAPAAGTLRDALERRYGPGVLGGPDDPTV